jgi:hypothetical protein
MPLLSWNLSTICPESIPPLGLAQFRDYLHSNAKRNLFLTGLLVKHLNLFKEHGIEAVPFKGPVLAHSVYGNLMLRDFGDLDILVRKEDVFKVKELLIRYNYGLPDYIPDAELAARSPFMHALTFISGDGLVNLDVHWRVSDSYFFFPFDYERMWKRLETLPLAGTDVLVPTAEDMMLILSVHGSKHCWERLLWICDLSEFIKAHPDIDWERVIEESIRLRFKRMLFLGLYLVNDLLGTPLPEKIRVRIQSDSKVSSLAEMVLKDLFSEPGRPIRLLEHIALLFNLRERWKDRLKYFNVRHWAIPNVRDRSFVSLPQFLSSLYYFLRPLRLLTEYGPSSTKLLLKKLLHIRETEH